MRKNYPDQSDCCPDCVNENNEAESCVQCDDDQCCSCCCSCCSGSESEVESRDVNAMESNSSKSMEERFRAQKKNLISSLSITRTNRERATIQNVLQFVEALTHSSSFLRRYNLQEEFCLQCLEESFRDLYTPSSPTNPGSCCSSNGCGVTTAVEPNRNVSQVDGCLECSPPSKTVEEGHGNRNRRIRSRMRPRNSTRGRSNSQNRPANANDEPASYDSDCSECRRGMPCKNPQELGDISECECCQNPTSSNVPEPQYRDCSSDKCADCNQNSRLMSECCSNFHDGHSNCPESCCESDYEACGRSEAERTSCDCCSNSTFTTIRSSRPEPIVECGRFSEASDKESEPCNCEECRDSIECSDQSCDECTPASRNSNRKNKNKK